MILKSQILDSTNLVHTRTVRGVMLGGSCLRNGGDCQHKSFPKSTVTISMRGGVVAELVCTFVVPSR